MSDKSAGTPNIEITPTVITLIGIIRPTGCTNKLYAYNKKELITIRLITLNISFNILST